MSGPSRGPSARKFGTTVWSSRPSRSTIGSTCFTLSSSATSSTSAGVSRPSPGSSTSARAQRLADLELGLGARGPTERDDLPRRSHVAARAPGRSRRRRPRASRRGGRTRVRSPPRGSTNSSSATNGHSGASSSATVRRHSCSVACAAGSAAFQNRARERRTYQFERSSTNDSSACAARSASNPSSASVTSRTVEWRRERTHRSSTCVAGTASVGALGRPAVERRVGHEERVGVPERQRGTGGSTRRSSARRRAGSSTASRRRRSTSGARRRRGWSRIVHGSMTLPRDFDIF